MFCNYVVKYMVLGKMFSEIVILCVGFRFGLIYEWVYYVSWGCVCGFFDDWIVLIVGLLENMVENDWILVSVVDMLVVE